MTILVVEDDVDVRAVLSLMLEQPDRRVAIAGNASEAMEFARSAAVDVFLVDVILPDIDGRDLVDQLRVLHPRAGILFMSGWYDHPRFPELDGAAVLQKPFSRAELNGAITAVLPGEP